MDYKSMTDTSDLEKEASVNISIQQKFIAVGLCENSSSETVVSAESYETDQEVSSQVGTSDFQTYQSNEISSDDIDLPHETDMSVCEEVCSSKFLFRNSLQSQPDKKGSVGCSLTNLADLSVYEKTHNCSGIQSFTEIDSGDDDKEVEVQKNRRLRKDPFVEDVRQVMLRNHVDHKVVNEMLEVLRTYTKNPFPKDARTLLGTSRSTDNVAPMGYGRYYHRGLQNVTVEFARKYRANHININTITLVIMIDGAEFAKSSEKSLFLKLCAESILDNVYLVGAYYGEGKPKDSNEFLRLFVDEMQDLVESGLEVDGFHYKVLFSVIFS